MSNSVRLGLFLASDARTQYAEDVLTALALPTGAALQLRYDVRYMSDELTRMCRTGHVVGHRFLFSFISSLSDTNHYLVPVRFCQVVNAQEVGGVWVFRITMDVYPLIDDWPEDAAELEAHGRHLTRVIGDVNTPASFPFATHSCRIPVRVGDDDALCWKHIARRLSAVPAFGENRHLIKIGPPVELNNSRVLRADATGIFPVIEERNYRITVSYWAAHQAGDEHCEIETAIWGEGADIISPLRTPLKSRYDSFDVLLKSLPVSSPSLCRLDLNVDQREISMTAYPLKVGAQLTFRVSTSRPRVIARVGVSALAALLLAVPSMLGPGTPVEARVAIAGLGAVALGIASSGAGTWGRK
ncbi:hypothetical protein ACFV28_28460 [Streptomyces sp. NPDC059720]|uniref:hypothetical protein n=1 Tax=Streptomyces sp. NPDC059720 TaxID=3346924 RepID=UPI0036911945